MEFCHEMKSQMNAYMKMQFILQCQMGSAIFPRRAAVPDQIGFDENEVSHLISLGAWRNG